MERPEVTKAEASQRLYFMATEGRPTAAPTVAIKAADGTVLSAAASTYVTQMGPDTTVSAASALGSDALTLTSVTGVTIGRMYLATNKLGQQQWVVPRLVNASTKVVTLTKPLEISFATLSTNYGSFQSTEFYYTLQTADVAALHEMALGLATYAFDSLTHHIRVAFDVVLHPLANPLTAEELYKRWPDLGRQEPDEQRGSDFAAQRATAWSHVKRRLRQHGSAEGRWRPAMVFDAVELFEAAVGFLALELHSIGVQVIRTDPPPSFEELTRAAEREMARALTTVSVDLDEDESCGEDESERIELDYVR